MSHDTALGGAKKLGQKALFLAAGAIFGPKKARNWPKLAKIKIFLKSEQIFLASEYFSVGFFCKNYFGNLLGIPWSTCVPIFINLGYSGAISIGGALNAPHVAPKEFYMPY